jgi:hypothetical protein
VFEAFLFVDTVPLARAEQIEEDTHILKLPCRAPGS